MVSASNNRIGNAMSVVKRGNSKNWYMHFQLNGQTYIRSSRTTNKKIAEQMEIEWKAMLHSQQYQGRKQRITLADAFHQYKLSKQGIASYRNLIAHETVLHRLLPMKKHIDEITSRDLEKFKRDRVDAKYSFIAAAIIELRVFMVSSPMNLLLLLIKLSS